MHFVVILKNMHFKTRKLFPMMCKEISNVLYLYFVMLGTNEVCTQLQIKHCYT